MGTSVVPEDTAAYREVSVLEARALREPEAHTTKLAWALNRLADTYRTAGMDVEAFSCLERAVEVVAVLVYRDPTRLAERWELTEHLANIASESLRQGQPLRGVEPIRCAQDLVATLAGTPCPIRIGLVAYVHELSKLDVAITAQLAEKLSRNR